jgi:hypothetical protein
MKAKDKGMIPPSQPESARLGQLLTETVALIAQKQAALAQIPSEKRHVLGESDLNVDGIVQLDTKRSALDVELHDLEMRRMLLHQRLWQAEVSEAQVRLATIATEAAGLVTALGQARTVLDDCQAALIAALTTVVDVHVRHVRLLKEHNWITSSYRLPPIELPRLSEFAGMPELTVKVGEACEVWHQEQLRPPLPRKRRPVTDSVFEEA